MKHTKQVLHINQLSSGSIAGKRFFLGTLLASAWAVSGCAAKQPAVDVNLSAEDKALIHKFRGLHGIVLRLDAASEKKFTSIRTDKGVEMSGAGTLSLTNVGNQSYTDNSFIPVPKTIRATWRRDDPDNKIYSGKKEEPWSGGVIIGDYTVPVAERIPDDVLDYIRKNGGALRLKIRLLDQGIAIGWDVEHVIPYKDWKPNSLGLGSGVNYRMAGGDFKEARPADVVFEDGYLKKVPSSVPTPLSASDEAMLKRHDLMLVKGAIVTNPPTPANHQRIWEKGWYINKSGEKIFTDY